MTETHEQKLVWHPPTWKVLAVIDGTEGNGGRSAETSDLVNGPS
jgi:hypothetical protein